MQNRSHEEVVFVGAECIPRLYILEKAGRYQPEIKIRK